MKHLAVASGSGQSAKPESIDTHLDSRFDPCLRKSKTLSFRRNSLVSSVLFQSGVAVPNGIMAAQLQAGAEFFTVPFWKDLPDTEANLSSDESNSQ
jgi:hypothetical protein